MNFKYLFATLVAVTCSMSSFADTLGVIVSHSGDDLVGKRLAVEVKNSVRNSTLFHLIYTPDDKVYGISLVTIDPDEDTRDADLRTTYSATFILNSGELFDYHMTSIVGVCGADKVKSCSEKLIQDLSVQHEDLLEAMVQAGAFD